MSPEFQALSDQVTATVGVEDSAAVLLAQLKTLLDAAIAALPDTSALVALSTSLKDHSDALAAAVAANTPPTP